MIKGEIEIRVLDAETLQEQDRRIQSNIILNTVFDDLMNSVSYKLPTAVAVTTKKIGSSRRAVRIPTADTTLVTSIGTTIPGHTAVEWFDAAGGTPMFVQFSTRIDVPSAARQINTILLTDLTSGTTLSSNTAQSGGTSGSRMFAFANLAAPCDQSTSQLLDVYYRIYFPDAACPPGLSMVNYTEIAKRIGGVYGTSAGVHGNLTGSAFKLPVLKYTEDQQALMISGRPYMQWNNNPIISSGSVTGTLWKRKFTVSWALANQVGGIFSQLAVTSVDAPTAAPGQPLTGVSDVPNLPGKVQNLFGRHTNNGHVFLDVDNLPLGTGKVIPGGSWVNKFAPNAPDLYYSGRLPAQFYVQIVAGGQVGAATYKLRKRNYFHQAIDKYALGQHGLPATAVFPLCSNKGIANSLLGDPLNFTVKQLSAIVKYDEVSVAIPLKNQVIIYNLANGEYWRYKASYTNIEQLAVVSGKIYVSCRDTGLWIIDPLNSNVPTKAAPGGAIINSNCYGVAPGFNNSVWAVLTNGLVKLEAGSWSLYNETSTPALVKTGISDSKWSNVEFLKANASTAAGEVFLVRKTTADVDVTITGIWWSLAGVVSNGVANIAVGTGVGSPRVHRAHIECGPDGRWLMTLNSQWRLMTFGTANLGAAYGSINAGTFYSSFGSVLFAPNAAGVQKHLQINSGSTTSQITLYNTDGSIDTSLLDTSTVAAAHSAHIGSSALSSPDTSGVGGTYAGNYDLCTAVNMGNGLVFTFGTYGKTAGAAVGEYAAMLNSYPLDRKMGGALQHLAYTDYGWDGANWVAGNANARPTHSAAQPALEGTTLTFTDGTSGASFVAGEWYNFGVCEGVLKDNATTNNLEVPLYFKKVYPNVTVITSNTVPVTANTSATGAVGTDLARTQTTMVSLNGAGEVVFASELGNQQWVGDKELVGDFKLQFNVSANANVRDVQFGIGSQAANAGPYASWNVDNTGALSVNYTNQNGANTTITTRSNSTALGNIASGVSSLGISRVGQTLNFLINDVVVALSATGTSLPQLITAGRSRFDIICTPADVFQWARQVANRTCPAPVVISNGSDNAVKVGSSLDNSGAFNPKFYSIDIDLTNGIAVTIGGVPATIKTNYAAPAAGEVSVDNYKGTFVFNAADEGKSLAITCSYMTHE